eukprot:3087154-Amphidinium_carterae.2
MTPTNATRATTDSIQHEVMYRHVVLMFGGSGRVVVQWHSACEADLENQAMSADQLLHNDVCLACNQDEHRVTFSS